MSFFYVLLKTLKIVIGPNFWLVLYVHINQTLSKVISFLFDEDAIIVVVVVVIIIILLLYLI